MNGRPVDDGDLGAFLDGEADAETRARVETWLAERPEDQARLAAWSAQANDLHEAFDPVLAEPLPPALAGLAERARRPGIPWARAAAAMLIFVAGLGLGYGVAATRTVPPESPTARLVKNALGAHVVFAPEIRHAVEVPADQEAHLVTWLSKRLGHKVKAPDLRGPGFRLVGGRLLADADGPAAQFMYENPAGQRVTLYVRTTEAARNTAFRFVEERGVSAFYWVDGPLAYALIGTLPRESLLTLATLVYDALLP